MGGTKLRTQCLYAAIRFMPFAETQEFANVGVVMIAPKLGGFKFKLAKNRFARVSNFFDDLEGVIYKNAIDSFTKELERVERFFVKNTAFDNKLVEHFTELTRHRESVMNFGNVSSIVTNNYDHCIDELFERLVERNFSTTPEYKEQLMARTLKTKLNSKLPVKFKEQKIKAGRYEFTLPLVGEFGNTKRIIKPLSFEKKTANQAYEHAHNWLSRAERLIKAEIIEPERALFALDKPSNSRNGLIQAYDDIYGELEDLNIKVVDYTDTPKIIRFASADLTPESVEKGFH